MALPKKAKIRINRTKKTLKMYESTFYEYMRDNCHRRSDINLGDIVMIEEEKGIICGWNGSCNYDVYIYSSDGIRNVHPSSVTVA